MSRPRLYGLLSLALLGGYGAAAALAARATGLGFEAVSPWPLGGGPGAGGFALSASSLALGLALGWGVPGASLALLTDRGLRGAALLGRALGLGCGYVLAVGLLHAALLGHAPGRATLLVLLALPPAAAALRGGARDALADPTLLVASALMLALTALLWGKLHSEGMNGDGTEAYELARSLDAHPAPYWDLERWEGPGRFGTPAVNPFLTNSFLVNAEMALLGRGELAARLAFGPMAVLCGVLAASRLARTGASGALHAAAVTAVFVVWNAYYVGYEPPFTDLAEPAFTDTFMTALCLAGFGELAAGSTVLGVAFLVLASGVLYSAPILATTALVVLALRPGAGRRALGLWLAAGVVVVPLALAYGAVHGDVGDWFRQVHSEYWNDLVAHDRRTPSLPILGHLLLITGALPLAAAVRWRALSRPALALLATSGVYLAIVAGSSYKNLHYLAPLPFLAMAPALEASGTRARAVATAVVLAALAMAWPSDRSVHRETLELGRASCVEGVGYEEAALGGDVVYDALDRPGRIGRLGVGKHTFVRYALDLGGDDCTVRLAKGRSDEWITVAGSDVNVSVRDVDAFARWRLRVPPVPRSWLFPRDAPAVLPTAARAWLGHIPLAEPPGSNLVLGRANRARVLVPAPAGTNVVFETRSDDAMPVGLRVNGADAADLAVPAGRARLALPAAAAWRDGWNVVELVARRSRPLPTIDALDVRVSAP